MSRFAKVVAGFSVLAVLFVGIAVWKYWLQSPKPSSNDNTWTTAVAKQGFELAADKQQEIWDAEHIAFEIEHTFAIPFKAALQSDDRQRLLEFFRADFTGHSLDLSKGVTQSQSEIREIRYSDEHEANSVSANEIIDSLLDSVGRFTTIEAMKLRTLEVNKVSTNGWTVRLLLTVAGVGQEKEWMEFESTQQVDFKFKEEIELGEKPVVSSWDIRSQLNRSSSHQFFVEATKQAGLDLVPLIDNWTIPHDQARQYRFQFAVVDFDLDGVLDIAVVDFERCYLLRRSSLDGKYQDVARQMGIRREPSAPNLSFAGWFDYNNDGYPDLLLGNQLYRNEKGVRFRNVTLHSGLTFMDDAMPMGVQVADFDCDGRLDLYLLYQSYGSASSEMSWINAKDDGVENQLFKNIGEGRFRNVTTDSGASGGKRKSFAATWFFFDEDHWPDLYIANDFSKNVLLRNNGDGTFTDISEQSQAADFATTMGVASGDTNNDGKTDIYVANMYSKMGRRILGHIRQEDYPAGYYEQILGSCAGNRLYLRAPAGDEFQEVGSRQEVQGVGWAYAPAIVDFDLDGYLDLYAATGFMSFNRKKPDG